MRIYFLKNTTGISRFVTLPLEILDKTKLDPRKLFEIGTSWGFGDQNPRSLQILRDFFLIVPEKFDLYPISSIFPENPFPGIANFKTSLEQKTIDYKILGRITLNISF